MEARNGDEVNAHASADHDVAPGHNESAAHITINHEDMENINIVDMVAPLAAVPGVLELSEEVSDRIASDNDALTDAFAAQVMEQSVTTDDSISAVNATGKVQLGLLAVGGCVASAALIALLRRIRRGRNKAAEDSSQKISGSGRGSRQGAGSVRSGGSHGVKGSASRSQRRRGTGSAASAQGARRGDHRAESARARSERVTSERRLEETAASAASGRKAAAETRTEPAKPRDTAPTPAVQSEVPPARKKRVPPLLSGNKARSRSDKDTESDKPASTSSATTDKASPASEHRLKSPGAPAGTASLPARANRQLASHSAAVVPAVAEARLNADAAEFHPGSSAAHAPASVHAAANTSTTDTATVAHFSVSESQESATFNGQDSSVDGGPNEPAEDAPVATMAVASDKQASQSSSHVETVKFNVDAPEFRPAAAVGKIGVDLSPEAPTIDQGNPVSDNDVGETQLSQLDEQTDSAEQMLGIGSGPAEVSAPTDEPYDDEDDDDVDFVHSKLVLAGRDITADAEETPDEKRAAQQLLEIAKELQRMGGGRVTPAELREKGLKELKADVDFCTSSQCRPLKVAEHASTAADFFFQLQSFDAAEEMLDIGVQFQTAGPGISMQAAQMAGDAALQTTLMHNLATSLRKRGKYNMALRLHRRFKEDIEAREGITSEYIVLARHSIVDMLTARGRGEECRAYLDDEVAKLQAHLATVTADQDTAHSGEEDAAKTKVATALQAIARCKMDYAKHFEACERHDDAIEMGRDALDKHRAAAEIDPSITVPMYANFMAVQLKMKGHRLRKEGKDEDALALYRESRDMFVELAAIVESQTVHGRKNQRLPMVYRQIADISMALHDYQSAFKSAESFVNSVMSVYQCRPLDPVMQQVWEYKAEIHSTANDEEGATNARKQALKCRSSVVRARGSHKAKQRKETRGS